MANRQARIGARVSSPIGTMRATVDRLRLEPLDLARELPGQGNPKLVCGCGRIQQADLFVYYEGDPATPADDDFICDGCQTRLRRTGVISRRRTARARRRLPRAVKMARRLADLEPRERAAYIAGRKIRRA